MSHWNRVIALLTTRVGLLCLAGALLSCGGGDNASVEGQAAARKFAADVTPPAAFFPNVTIPADANTRGMWSPVYGWPGVAVHAVVLPDGRVLTFGSATTGQQGAFSNYDIWDSTGAPDTGHLTLPNATGTDIFCSSNVLLPAESPGAAAGVFIAGGDVWTGTVTTNTPNQNSTVLDVATNTLVRKSDMQRARWYSTSTTLINGETYIQGGNGGTDRPEVRGLSGAFRTLSGADTSTIDFYFPRNFVAPDGRVFGFDSNGQMYYVNTGGNGSITPVGQFSSLYASATGSAAMFRPGRILQLSGNSSAAQIIDITGAGTPALTPTQAFSSQRQWVNATILADGKVLATGGSQNDTQSGTPPVGANNAAEIWNPTTGQWIQGPSAAKDRLYHSNAVLLPDASVLVAGGGALNPDGPWPNQLNAEIYYPPYFFAPGGLRASRPIVASAPDWVDIGTVIPVSVANASSVSRVTLVKTSATTHSFNMDQRFLDLTFQASGLNLSVQAPARAADAPPGHYMLFVFDEAGVPSVAKIVRIGIATVANPATVPTLTNPGAQTTDAGVDVSLALGATDPNGDPLTYSAAGLPAGLAVNTTTGVISGLPTSAGNFNVVATASDGVNAASASFVWTVNAINGVVIDPLPPVSATQAGIETTFTASTQGGTNVRYRWNFGDGTGDTGWSPSPTAVHSFANPGTYGVTFSATDDSGIVRTRSFLQTVYLPATGSKPSVSSNIVIQTPASGNPRLWVVNQDNDSVSAFDTVTRSKLAEITVGTAPRSIAVAANGLIWVTNKRSDSISVIDPATNTVVNTIALPRASQPFGIAMSPAAPEAFVVLEATGQLLKFNASSYALLGSASVGANPRQLSIGADGAGVYVSRFITPPLPGESTVTVTPTPSNGAEVVVISAGGMSFIRTIVLQHSDKVDAENSGRGIPNYLGAATISPDGTQAWVPSKQDNIKRGALRDGTGLSFQNTVRAVSSRIVLGTGLEDLGKRVDHDNSSVATAAVYDSRGVYLFVALETSREVAVVDAHGGSQVMRVDVGRAPQGLALSGDGKTLYVNNFMDRTVGVYDLQPLLTNGQLSVPLLATLGAVAAEGLTATVLLGKQHFYDARDPRLALDRYLSCASCHNDGGSDGRTWDITGQGEGLRNTIALRGRAGAQGLLHWSGNFDEVQDFEGQIRTLAGGTGLMDSVAFNAGTRSQPLGDPKAGVSGDLDALAAYVGSLNAFEPSPYRDPAGALSAAAVAGRSVFSSQNCAACHGGASFTNSASMGLQNVGTLKQPSSGTRLGGPLTGIDIPTLRDVWQPGSYLHDGSAPTLEAAVLAHNGVTLGSADLSSLVQYLREIGSEESVAPGAPPLPGGLTAALAFNEGVGTSSSDLTGTGHTATLQSGTAWAAGQYGSALSLDGIDDQVALANAGSIETGAADFTFMAWVKRSAIGGQQRHIFSKCGPSSWQAGCKELYFSPSNTLILGDYASGDTNSVTVADTNWHHVALVFTRATNTVQFYVDGTLRTTATKNLEPDNPAHGLTIGNLFASNPFSGLIDEVRIYSRARTAAEVATDMNTPLAAVVDTAPPALSGGLPSGVLGAGTTQTTLSVTSNENATCRYAATAGTAYASMPNTFGTTGATAHSTLITGLVSGQSYSYYVRCEDVAGNADTVDLAIGFSVAAPDTTAPTVTVSAPAGGATVTATVSVTANAADNVGVVGVQFLLDGVNLGSEDTTSPYAVSWNSAGAANGSHTLTARARDAAGNQTTSAGVTVTVSNSAPDTTAPTVSVSAPAAGATVAGTLSVTAIAADNLGVAGVQFLLDGANLGVEVTAAPYQVSWNTAGATNGAHSISARARDAAGNQTTSAVVGVSVSNAAPTGLVAAYGFNEGTGTTLTDLSGNANAGTISGATWSTAGKFGNTLVFDGTGAQVTIPNSSSLQLTAGMTLEAWVYPTTAPTGWRAVVAKNVDRYYLMASSDQGNSPAAGGTWAAGNQNTFGTSALAANTWTHLAATFDGATVRLYVNGVQAASQAQTTPLVSTTGTLQIGGDAYPGEFFAGRIDEVRIYNRALTAAEVATDMNSPVAPVADTTPPVLSGGLPSGVLAAGTTQTTLSVTSNENATCRYAATAGTAYASMPNTFGTTGATAHSTLVTGLVGGQSYSYYVRCQDAALNADTTDLAIGFSVPDATAPTVNLSAPTAGATVTGTVGVAANAGDNVGVVGVQFLLDGANLGTEDTTAPYAVSWDSASAINGSHTLTARARDAAGNQTTSVLVIVTVSNIAPDTTPPVLGGGLPSGVLAAGTTQTTMGVTSNENATCRYATTAGTAYGSMANTFGTTGGTTHSTLVTGLVNGQTYNYHVRCQDAALNANTADLTIGFSVAAPDTTAPTVSVSAPAAGATVAGTLSVTAIAADNLGVAGVQFLLDGANLGVEVTAAPYQVSWNTAGATNGAHSISARARDAAGNQTTSAVVGVSVSNAAPTGLVAAYGFNEGTGTTLTDLSGNANAGTISGATWSTAGKFGNTLVFDGTGAQVTIPNSSSLQLTAGMTLEAWVYPTTAPTGWRAVVAKNVDRYYLMASSDQGNSPAAGGTWAAGNQNTFGTSALAANTWTHLAATFDGATVRLYVNGVQAASQAQTTPLVSTTGTLQIGGDAYPGEFFAGRIDEVRIYNRALTAAEVATDMNSPVAPVADTTPPVLSGGLPSGVLAAGTTQTTLSVTSNENATCRYAATAGTAYASMPNTFGTTGATAHSTLVTGLVGGQSYSYYVRCQDAALNADTADLAIGFSVATPDTTPPAVTARSPVSGATGVGGTANVTATFSEPLGATTINSTTFELRDASNVLVPAAVTYNATTRVATLNPTPTLTQAAEYTATIKGGATDPRVKDVAGIPLAANVTWSFTIAPDLTAPTVTATSPASGATGVSPTANVTATFSEAMNAATINTSTVELRDPANALVPAVVTVNAANRIATLNPTPSLAATTTYTVTVRGGTTDPRVKDAAGNALTTSRVWSFTTQ